MPRARLLKPGFFSNEILAELSPLHRLCYAGLWTIADKKGRLEDRPQRIKLAVLPFDQVDVTVLLNDLEARGFIQRYVVGADHYIAIPTWDKHQHPHINEADSAIPAPSKNGAGTVRAPSKHRAASSTGGNGTVAAPDDSALYLDPESCTGSGVRKLDPEAVAESVHPSAPLRGASPLKGASPLRGSRRLKRNIEASKRAVAHIRARGAK